MKQSTGGIVSTRAASFLALVVLMQYPLQAEAATGNATVNITVELMTENQTFCSGIELEGSGDSSVELESAVTFLLLSMSSNCSCSFSNISSIESLKCPANESTLYVSGVLLFSDIDQACAQFSSFANGVWSIESDNLTLFGYNISSINLTLTSSCMDAVPSVSLFPSSDQLDFFTTLLIVTGTTAGGALVFIIFILLCACLIAKKLKREPKGSEKNDQMDGVEIHSYQTKDTFRKENQSEKTTTLTDGQAYSSPPQDNYEALEIALAPEPAPPPPANISAPALAPVHSVTPLSQASTPPPPPPPPIPTSQRPSIPLQSHLPPPVPQSARPSQPPMQHRHLSPHPTSSSCPPAAPPPPPLATSPLHPAAPPHPKVPLLPKPAASLSNHAPSVKSSVAKSRDPYLKPELGLPQKPGFSIDEVEEIYDTMSGGVYSDSENNDVQEIYENNTPQNQYEDEDIDVRDYQNVDAGGMMGYHPSVPANDDLYI